jgi:UDP-2,3-diacylglucosamine pyrophosphatase LpxH
MELCKLVAISDLHLGSVLCQAEKLCSFLEELNTEELVLNGDVFDDLNFSRLTKTHWRVLSLLRKHSKNIKITWVVGNHDGPVEVMSHILGVSAVERYLVKCEIANAISHLTFIHGHQFDEFISKNPFLTWAADGVYQVTARFKPSWARYLKKTSKTFLRNADKVREGAIEYANTDIVVCGHTHHAVVEHNYVNLGCWTEEPCTFLKVTDKDIKLATYS